MTTLTGAELSARDLPDWRFVLRRAEATFTCGSFAAAGALAARVAEVADELDHHPDLDLHFPGRLHVVTTSHDAGGVTERDVRLASRVSVLAREAGATSDPLAASTLEVAVDALDIDAVRPFWAAVLGYVDKPPAVEGDLVREVVDPRGFGPAVWFQEMTEPRPQRNRIHLDVTVPPEVADERVAAALAAGGRLVSDEHARAWWVLADAEGNEACVCTWEDRG